MNILFDHQIYTNQNYGGISRYFYELSRELTLLGNRCENSVLFSENEFTGDPEHFSAWPFVPFQFKGRHRVKEFINREISVRAIRKGGFDVFHPTYYDTYHVKRNLPSQPFVVTFYDLIHEKLGDRYPDHLTNLDQVKADRAELLQKAAAVIAISESTKRDLIEHYHVSEDRIYVTHLASSLGDIPSVAGINIDSYILFVGNRAAYKNFDTFIAAVQPLLHQERWLKVVCAGGGKFNSQEMSLIGSLGITAQVSQVPVNDRILATLYRQALFFVFPSLYEGFGIPVLEAFSCGCPTILSDVSSLPEIGGNAALYIAPEDKADILAKSQLLVYNSLARQRYRERGLARAANFSWQKLAIKTLDVYRSIL